MTHPSRPREVLAELTRSVSEHPCSWHEGYRRFLGMIGVEADSYDTYVNAAVTSAGYRRDTSLSRRQAIDMNTDTALLIADEAADGGLIDLERTIDAVSLGHIPTWEQSSYLLFFLAAMSRPDPSTLDGLANSMATADSYDLSVFNNQDAPNEVRLPHYFGLTNHFWSNVRRHPYHPIDTMIESFDRTMTLGGRAEERLALHMGTRVLQPILISETRDISSADINPKLRAHYERLSGLGADLFAQPQVTRFGLREILIDKSPS